MIKLVKGTKEHIQVSVADRLGSLTTLDAASPRFSTRKRYETTWIEQDIPATNIGLNAYCLIDTTGSTYDTDIHELFLRFSNLPEVPYIGPFEFEVTA